LDVQATVLSAAAFGAWRRFLVSYTMNAKHRRTLEAIFAKPVPPDIRWADIESLLVALGAQRSEGRGSRVRFVLGSAEAVFHRPHPSPSAE
jgi:HicA toxin of bacterial toxin-antitoxin,